VLELGAGPGFFAPHVAERRGDLRWLSADLAQAPWNHLAADAQRLPFRDASFGAVVALDLIHHLAEPERGFREAARVLAPGGRLSVVEPWPTPFSYPLYRWLHQEGLDPGRDPWAPFAAGPGKDPFEGDSGTVRRLVRETPAARWHALGFLPPRVTLLNGFAYLLTLGFREASLLPSALAAPLLGLDRATAALAPCFGFRARLVWEREA
jgi:SAM-dependent methyltransferase